MTGARIRDLVGPGMMWASSEVRILECDGGGILNWLVSRGNQIRNRRTAVAKMSRDEESERSWRTRSRTGGYVEFSGTV